MATQTKLTKAQLEKILTSRLNLKSPEYLLTKVGGRLVGNIVSPSFKGKRDHERQEMIWDALETELGAGAPRLVGMLLAYTPEEWNLGAEPTSISKRAKKAG
jgi:stress-induced morphogen